MFAVAMRSGLLSCKRASLRVFSSTAIRWLTLTTPHLTHTQGLS